MGKDDDGKIHQAIKDSKKKHNDLVEEYSKLPKDQGDIKNPRKVEIEKIWAAEEKNRADLRKQLNN